MIRIQIRFVICLFVLLTNCHFVAAQQSEKKTTDLLYRQIKVEEKDLDEILAGTVPLLRSQFEEMLSAVNRSGRQNAESSPEFRQGAYIRQAMYYGRVQGGQIVDGRAVLGIDADPDREGLVPLVPLSIAIDSPQWAATPTAENQATMVSATCGVTDRNIPLVKLAGSGELMFNWSLSGTTVIESEKKFSFDVPQSESSYLIFDLPTDLVLRSSGGIVWNPVDGEVPLPLEGLPELQEQFSRWVVQLGTQSRTMLTVLSGDTVGTSTRVLFYSQDLQYSLSREGLELVSQITLDSVGVQRQSLVFQLTSDTELVRVTAGGTELIPTRLDGSENQWSVTLDGTAGQVLVSIEAISRFRPLQPQVLPLIKVVDGIWRQGQVSLVIADDLDLYRLDVQGALESRIESAAMEQRRILEMFDPSPHIVVVAGHQEAELHASQVSRFEIEPGRINLQTEVRLTAATESMHQLHLEVFKGWVLEAVHLERDVAGPQQYLPRVLKTERTGSTIYEIDLQEGIEPGRLIALRMNLTREIKTNQISGETLTAVAFPSVAESTLQKKRVVLQQHLVGLTTKRPNVLSISELGASQVNRLDLATDEVSSEMLLRDVEIVFADASYVSSLQIGLAPATQTFEARLETDITVSDVVNEETRIQINPLGTPVKKVVIYSSGLSGTDVTWELAKTGDSTVSVGAVASVEMSEEDGWQRWQIELVDPRVNPFELKGVRTLDRDTFLRVPLYRVEGAQLFTASAEIGWSEQVHVDISREQSIERVLPSRLRGSSSFFVEAIEYGMPVGTPPQVALVSRTEPLEHVVWNAHVHSKYLIHGHSSHEIRYVVEQQGLHDLLVDLPPQVAVESVWVDNQAIHLASIRRSDSPQRLQIPLQTETRFAKVRIRFTTSSASLGFRTELQKPLPEVNARVLQSYWSVAVPPGYELARQSKENSVAVRLFGPWLRKVRSGQGGETGWRRSAGEDSDGQLSKLNSLLERAALIRPNADEVVEVTWSDWLRNVQMLLNEEWKGYTLAVDVVALNALGINPATPLDTVQEVSHRTSVMQWLEKSELAFVRDGQRIILSSDRWIDEDLLSQGRFIEIDSEIRPVFTTYELAGGSVIRLEDWILGRRVLSLLSEQEVRQLHETLRQDLMWTYESGVKQAGTGISLVVYNNASLVTASWASLFVWFGLFLWFSRKKWEWAFIIPSLTATVAMFIGDVFVGFGAQAFIASLAVAVCTIVTRLQVGVREPRVNSELDFELQSRPGMVAPLLVLAVALGSTHLASAFQPPPVTPDTARDAAAVPAKSPVVVPSVHNVYFPVDSEGKDAGEYLYVADEFYQKLRKWYSRVGSQTESWLITEAQYQVNWLNDEQDSGEVTPVMNVSYHMELSEGEQQITLPLDARQSEIQEVVVEGEPVEFQWLADRQAVQIPVSQEGNVTVELELIPVVQSLNNVHRFEIDIPGVPESTLETSPISDEHQVLLTGSLGRIHNDTLGGRIVAALGSTRRLGVLWGVGDVEIAGSSVLESEEYYWLRIAPHAVVMDVRMKIDVIAGTTQQFSMNVDPRLRLLPIRPGQLVVGAPRIRDGDTKTLYFSLQRPVSDSFEVQLSFYLEDVSGIGNVPIPEVTPVVQRRRARWLALSVEDDLTWRSSLESVSDALQAEVLAQWGNQESPQAVYALVDGQGEMSEPITTLPRVVKTEVVQSCDVIVNPDELLMLYHAELLLEDGVAFQQRFQVPSEFVVESATLHQEGVVLEAKVQHSNDGYLSVFTDAGISGELVFELRGKLPVRRRTLPIPTITHEQGIVMDDQIRIIQRSGTLVQVVRDNELTQEAGDYLENVDGRLVAEFDSSREAGDSSLSVLRINTVVRGAASGGLAELDGNRMFEIRGELQVVEGQVDQLQLKLQNVLFDSIEESTGGFTLESRQIAPKSYLVTLRPDQLISDTLQFHLKLELQETDGILELPRFEVVNNLAGNVQQFFYAPNLIDQQKMQWEAVGAQRITTWSHALVPEQVTTETHTVFLGTGETEIRSTAFIQRASRLQVQVASYELAVIDRQHLVGVARFYVLPSRGQDLTLLWPELWKLETVTIQGTAVVPEVDSIHASAGEQRSGVVIPLLSDRQYQQVDVVFSLEDESVLAGGQNLILLPVPENEVVTSTIEILASNADYKLLRFDSDNLDTGSLSAVFANEVDWGMEVVSNQLTGNFEVNESLLAEQEYWQKYRDRLQLLDDFEDSERGEVELTDLPDTGFGYRDYQLLQAPGIRLAAMTDGALPQVLIHTQLHSSSVLIWWQLGVILGVLAISVLVYFLTVRGWFTDWVSHAPMSPVVLLGVIWWTFFTPSFIGIALVLVALLRLFVSDGRFIKVRFHWVREARTTVTRRSQV